MKEKTIYAGPVTDLSDINVAAQCGYFYKEGIGVDNRIYIDIYPDKYKNKDIKKIFKKNFYTTAQRLRFEDNLIYFSAFINEKHGCLNYLEFSITKLQYLEILKRDWNKFKLTPLIKDSSAYYDFFSQPKIFEQLKEYVKEYYIDEACLNDSTKIGDWKYIVVPYPEFLIQQSDIIKTVKIAEKLEGELVSALNTVRNCNYKNFDKKGLERALKMVDDILKLVIKSEDEAN